MKSSLQSKGAGITPALFIYTFSWSNPANSKTDRQFVKAIEEHREATAVSHDGAWK